MLISYRNLTTTEDFERAGELEALVWGAGAHDIVPSALMRALTINGGVINAAFAGAQMVGVALAFPGVRGGRLILWSHMTGVHPDYQGRDIGFTLKQNQRTWALQRGFDEIRWTFDPLQRGNANFNLHRLGAVANLYHEDFYGIMRDGINPPLPSDRLEVIWALKSPRVAALASGQMQLPTLGITPEALLLSVGADGEPVKGVDLLSAADPCFVEVPHRAAALPDNRLLTWRLALRAALQSAFSHGFNAIDCLPTSAGGAYVLTRAR